MNLTTLPTQPQAQLHRPDGLTLSLKDTVTLLNTLLEVRYETDGSTSEAQEALFDRLEAHAEAHGCRRVNSWFVMPKGVR